MAFVPTIANINAPTTTELNAGLLLQDVLTVDGLSGFQANTTSVDNTALSSTFSTSFPGRDEFSNTQLKLKKQVSSDTAYTTLTKNTTGNIVIRRYISASTAWASGQNIDVYPITVGRPSDEDYNAGNVAKYNVPVMISSAPSLRASVA